MFKNVTIQKDTWSHSKNAWYICDAATGQKLHYTGYTSKKAAVAFAAHIGATIVSSGQPCNAPAQLRTVGYI